MPFTTFLAALSMVALREAGPRAPAIAAALAPNFFAVLRNLSIALLRLVTLPPVTPAAASSSASKCSARSSARPAKSYGSWWPSRELVERA